MEAAVIQFIIFAIIVGAVLYGVYRLAKRNGDLKDAKGDLSGIKHAVTDHLPKL